MEELERQYCSRAPTKLLYLGQFLPAGPHNTQQALAFSLPWLLRTAPCVWVLRQCQKVEGLPELCCDGVKANSKSKPNPNPTSHLQPRDIFSLEIAVLFSNVGNKPGCPSRVNSVRRHSNMFHIHGKQFAPKYPSSLPESKEKQHSEPKGEERLKGLTLLPQGLSPALEAPNPPKPIP